MDTVRREEKKKKKLFPVDKYNIATQNAYKHKILITSYRSLSAISYQCWPHIIHNKCLIFM